MAYGRRKPFTKRPARKGVSKLLKAKPTAITALAKAVKAIQSKMKAKTILLNYGQQVDNIFLSADVDQFKLSNYSAWTPIFGAAGDDDDANKMIHKSFGVDMLFTLGNEMDQINYTVFLVSLKDSCRGAMFNNSSGALSLSSGTDYYFTNGLALLNKKSFNIHAMKRFSLGNNGVNQGDSTAQTQYGSDRRIYLKARCNKKVENPAGNWKDLNCSSDPSDNYYILVFNDNAIADAQYQRVRMNIIHTVEQLA